MEKNIILIDIDGPLTNYPQVFVDWVNEMGRFNFRDISDMKSKLTEIEYKIIKMLYRVSGIKANLPLKKDAIKVINKLVNEYEVIIYTTRPKVEPVVSDTNKWLRNCGLKFNRIIYLDKQNKLDFIKNIKDKIAFIIDDDENLINISEELNCKIYLFNSDKSGKNIKNIDNWIKILEDLH